MAELVDVLLVFWCVFAGAVYAVGYFVEQRLREQREQQLKLDAKRWTAANSTPTRQSSGQLYYATGAAAAAGRPSEFERQYSSLNSSSTIGGYSAPRSSGYATEYEPPQVYSGGADWPAAGSKYSSAGQHALSGHPNAAQDHLAASAADDSPVASIPVATGFNSDCVNWVNEILFLLFTQASKYGETIGESVTRSLNEKLSSLTSASGELNKFRIEFERMNRESCSKPVLTNIRTESESDKSISVNCKIYNKFASFDMKVAQVARRDPRGGGYASAIGADFDEPLCYELVLENLEGKLRSVAMLSDKLIVIQFLEKPDTKIVLRPKQLAVGQFSRQAAAAPLVREEALVQVILQTLTQVVVDLYFGDDVDFPQFKALLQHTNSPFLTYKNKFNNILKRQKKHDFLGALSSSPSSSQQATCEAVARKLFVKILKAKNINYNQNVTCLLELDSPRQHAISSTRTGSNPVWDEHFLFRIQNEKAQQGAELIIELWDSINERAVREFEQMPPPPSKQVSQQETLRQKHWLKSEVTNGAKFLGLARVKIDELRREPSLRASFALQAIGNDLNSSVGGELELELLLLEHSITPTATTLSHSTSADSMLHQQQGDVVSVDRKLTPSGYVITTTTIQRQPSLKRRQRGAGRAQSPANSVEPTNEIAPLGGAIAVGELDAISHLGELGSTGQHVQHATDLSAVTSQAGAVTPSLGDGRSEAPSDSTGAPGRLSRSRSRSRSLLRAIKKRFSFSRTRSRSVGESGARGRVGGSSSVGGGATPTLDFDDDDNNEDDYLHPSASSRNLDSPSLESRSRASSELSAAIGTSGGNQNSTRAKSVPTQRHTSEVPTIVINKGRLSDAASAFNFAQPKSQLVIEVMEPALRGDGSGNKENGRLRYYALSEEEGNKRKWRKRGIKLHLFNEHQFVAAHLAGSSTCHLCGRLFSRRPGKQGYRCRNCHLLSHKQCHVKVDHNCPYSTRDGLKLEYIDADPPAGLVDEVSGASSARRQSEQQELDHRYSAPGTPQRTDRPNLKMTSKSISMDVDDR